MKTVEFQTYLTIPIQVKAMLVEGMTQLDVSGDNFTAIPIESIPEAERERLYELARKEAQIENGNNS